MPNAYSVDDLLDFLDHAAKRGLMPAATAQALAVASRNVLGVLTEDEKKDLAQVDVDAVVKRFTNKRAKDFNPSSLKVYGQRVHKAVRLFLDWRNDPASFTVKTRSPRRSARQRNGAPDDRDLPPAAANVRAQATTMEPAQVEGTYQPALPIRPDVVVTLLNVPVDLTSAEADRLATFVKMLVLK